MSSRTTPRIFDVIGLVDLAGEKTGIPRCWQQAGAVGIDDCDVEVVLIRGLAQPGAGFHELADHGGAVQGQDHGGRFLRIVLGRDVNPVGALQLVHGEGALFVVARSASGRPVGRAWKAIRISAYDA